MLLPSDSIASGTPASRGAAASDAVLDVLVCVRSLAVASRHVLTRLRDTGVRVRLGRLGDRCAEALEELEHALEGVEPSAPSGAPIGAWRASHGLRSVIEVGGVGADLCLLLELDVLAARLQARIEGLRSRDTPLALRDTLGKLSALVREIRAEYELYAA